MTTADVAAAHSAHDHVPEDEHFGSATGGKVAMWMFIAQDGMSFGGLLFAYGVIRSSAESWPDPAAVLGITLTAIATFLLICSSLTMVMAVESISEVDLTAWIVPLDEQSFRTIVVSDGFTIGADPACLLQLHDEGIAARHAVIRLESVDNFRMFEPPCSCWGRGS